jgi:hypothetical protein
VPQDHEESTVKKTVLFATAFALAFGPAVSYAQLTCNGIAVIGSSSNNSNQAQSAIATQMTHIMVCDPHSPAPPAWNAQEWSSGGNPSGTIVEIGALPRNPYATYAVNAAGRKQDNNLRGTIQYTYNGSPTAVYMISVTGTTGGNMFFCLDGTTTIAYTTTWFPATTPTRCS